MRKIPGNLSSIIGIITLTLLILACQTISGLATVTMPPPTIRVEPTSTPDCLRYDYLQEYTNEASCFEDWVAVEPGSFYAWSELGRVYGNQGFYEAGLEAKFTSLELATDPDDKAWTYVSIGVYYYKLERYAGAIDYLHRGLAVPGINTTSEAQLRVWLAWSYEAYEEYDEACSQFRKALVVAQQASYEWAVDRANEGLSRCN